MLETVTAVQQNGLLDLINELFENFEREFSKLRTEVETPETSSDTSKRWGFAGPIQIMDDRILIQLERGWSVGNSPATVPGFDYSVDQLAVIGLPFTTLELARFEEDQIIAPLESKIKQLPNILAN